MNEPGTATMSTATIMRRLSAIRVFFRFLLYEGLVVSDVVSNIESPSVWKRLPDTLSPEEKTALLKSLYARAGYGEVLRDLIEEGKKREEIKDAPAFKQFVQSVKESQLGSDPALSAMGRAHLFWPRHNNAAYPKIHELMKEQEMSISRERVRLIRRREGLQVVTKRKKRRILGLTTQWVHQALYPNHVWSYDFVFDQTEDRRTLKCMTVVD